MPAFLRRFLTSFFCVFLVIVGLSAPALAQGPPAGKGGQPLAELQALIGILNDKLDILDGKVDDLQTDVDGLSTDINLQGVRQNWDKKLDASNGDTTPARKGCDSDRFTCLWGDTAVRDNETGIVYDRSPDITGGVGGDGKRSWSMAIAHCANREVGGRKGWSLPMREQLASLVDTNNTLPALPTGHPFLNVQGLYWTASARADSAGDPWGVSFGSGSVTLLSQLGGNFTWCARGGQVYDGQNVLIAP